jgi:hypothetical protein
MQSAAAFLRLTTASLLLSGLAGCEDTPATDGGNGGEAATLGGGGGAAAGGASPDGGAGEGGGGGGSEGYVQSWDIGSDLIINGHAAQEEVKSAAALHQVIDGDDYISVVLTDVEGYCSAKAANECPDGPHFALIFSLNGIAPGTYDVTDGVAGALMGDVNASCLSGGLGAESGTITFSDISLGEGGGVKIEFDLQFLTGHAEGTATAPLCAG